MAATVTESQPGPPVHPWVAAAQGQVRFAVVGNGLRDWDATVAFVRLVEELGFDAYWANDHPTRSMDCWTYLIALAGVTRRLRLMSLVSCVYYRSPIALARQAADVDRVSGGRLVLGLGIGDDEPEFRQLGLAYPPPAERQQVLEETIHVVRGLWSGQPFSFEGRYFQLDQVSLRPGPVQQPHVPLLIGGAGERTTLRQVAAYADVSNFGAHAWAGSVFDAEEVKGKYTVLAQRCAEQGRPFDAILRSHYTPLIALAPTPDALERKRATARIPDPHVRTGPVFATPGEAVSHYQRLGDAGAQYFLVCVDAGDRQTLELLAHEVVPYLTPGTAAGTLA